jgi:hypothetical protein
LLPFILFALFLLVTPYLMSLLGIDKPFVEYILASMEKNGKQKLSVHQVHLGLGDVLLGDLTLVNQTGKVRFSAHGLRFSYNVFGLLVNLHAPQRAITNISVIDPVITIRSRLTGDTVSISATDTTGITLMQILDQFDNIDRINLKNGKIILENNKAENWVLAQNLDGWLGTTVTDSFDIEAQGDLLAAAHQNFSISAHFNKNERQISADLDVRNLDLKDLDFFTAKTLLLGGGLVNGKIHLHSPDLENLRCDGSLEIANGEFSISNWHVQDINAQASLVNNELQIPAGTLTIDGNDLSFTIRIADIFDPKLSAEIVSNRLDLKSVANRLHLPEYNNGLVTFSSYFQWQPGQLESKLNFQATDIMLCSQNLHNTQLNLTLIKDSLYIDKFTAQYHNFQLQSMGQIDFYSGDFNIQLSAEKKFAKHVLFDRLTDKFQQVDLSLLGNVVQKQIDGIWNYRISAGPDTVFNFSGDLKLENGHFHLFKNRTASENFTFSLDIIDIFGQPIINYGYIENPPWTKLSTIPAIKQIPGNIQLEGLINGPLNNINMQLTVQNLDHPAKPFIISGQIHNLFEVEKQLTGDITFHDFTGKIMVNFNEHQISATLQDAPKLLAQVNLDIAGDRFLNSKIDFNNFDLGTLYENDSATELGTINGSIKINGTTDNPQINARINGDRFVINNIGYYRFDLALVADTALVQVDSLRLYLNNVPALKGYLSLDLPRDSIRLDLYGSQVNFEDISQTLYNQLNAFTGTADYKIQMRGHLPQPKTTVQINLGAGKIYNIPFDQITLSGHDSMMVAQDYFSLTNHALVFDHFLAIKRGLYHLESSGVIPCWDNGPLNLDIKFTGDILSFIPKLNRFFIDGASFSDIKLLISGTPTNPKIEHGKIEIDRGELWLASVANHIQNIKGVIEKPAGTNKVLFKNFHAEVDNRVLEINTVDKVITSDGKKLESWYFDDLDLDFGILSLSTSPGGVRLQIPGLMTEGEQGNLELSGKTEHETFYLAGPVRHPYAWGRVTFADCRFSFPFPPSTSNKPDVAVQFLKNINWDVTVNPGVDLVYVRTIPAFIGDVNAEIVVDPESEGIHFTGIINENSFLPSGKLSSSRGTLEYLDLNFRVESYGVSFDRSDELPEVYGRAWTSIRDSVGAVPKTVYLELYAVDKETGQHNYRARWEDFRFRLVSADPTIGETQEQVLSYLGYSMDKIKEKATTVGGAVTENYVIRPLLRPIERRLEHYLGIDFVRFNSRIAKNIFQVGLSQWYGPGLANNNFRYVDTFSPYMILLESSELTLGKYLAKNIYITYTGQLIANSNPNQNDFGFNHSFGLEYRFFKNLLLEFEYDRETLLYTPLYTEKPYLEDFKIRLRHSFSF